MHVMSVSIFRENTVKWNAIYTHFYLTSLSDWQEPLLDSISPVYPLELFSSSTAVIVSSDPCVDCLPHDFLSSSGTPQSLLLTLFLPIWHLELKFFSSFSKFNSEVFVADSDKVSAQSLFIAFCFVWSLFNAISCWRMAFQLACILAPTFSSLTLRSMTSSQCGQLAESQELESHSELSSTDRNTSPTW